MRWTISRRRQVGIVVAVFVPLAILLQGLSQVGAQFPKGGGMPQPPVGPKPPGQNAPGFKPPIGPKQPFGGKATYEWRCSKCKAVVATTNTPFNPGVSDCPRCGVHFINGGAGKGGLLAPPNLPKNNEPPPGGATPNGPPAGFQPPNGPAPGFQPPNDPPAGFQPPVGIGPPNAPPAEFAAPNGLAPDALQPVAAPDDLAVPVGANDCRWCGGAAPAGNRYCSGCKLKMGGALLAGTIVVLGVVMIPVVLIGWFLVRSGGR
jgi:hypothetical protein